MNPASHVYVAVDPNVVAENVTCPLQGSSNSPQSMTGKEQGKEMRMGRERGGGGGGGEDRRRREEREEKTNESL